jgi:hypothetical protein
MAVQDDRREAEVRELFGLGEPEGRSRGDTDAELLLDGVMLPFELKSTTDPRRSVTTARDVSVRHITMWRGKHWVFGFYKPDGVTLEYCVYGSPQLMQPWLQKMEEYVGPDLLLAEHLPQLLTDEIMDEIVGRKDVYTLEDAQAIQKKQHKKAEYLALMDIEGGYSPERMKSILRDRARYLILRGSTLNNPHIPGSYFSGWERIESNHAERLRELVAESLRELEQS